MIFALRPVPFAIRCTGYILDRRLRARSLKRDAFSLIELCIVLLITSIFAAVAVPKWIGALQTYRAATVASRIATDLALAQSAAYSSSASRTVTFSVGSSQYTVDGIRPLNRASGQYIVSVADEPYRCTLVSVWGQTGQQSIIFDGYGKPNRGGTIIVSAGNVLASIIVNPNTGVAVVP